MAIYVMEILRKLAGLAENAIFGAPDLVCLGRWGRAAMSINALDLLATASVLARCHARDQTKSCYLCHGWLVVMTEDILSEFLVQPQT